jgi:hypothetical protein
MTYALRGACTLPAHALAAPTAPAIALTALTALGLSDDRSTSRSTPGASVSGHPATVRDLAEDAVSADASGALPCHEPTVLQTAVTCRLTCGRSADR